MKKIRKNELFLNSERFKAELKRHEGRVAPVLYTPDDASPKYKPRPARLDRQGEVAFLIHVSKAQMSNWLAGRETITIERLQDLGELFGCDWQYLCDLTKYRTFQDAADEFWEDWNKPTPATPYNLSFVLGIGASNHSLSVSCEDMPVEKLVEAICKYPTGYEMIIKGLAAVAANMEYVKDTQK